MPRSARPVRARRYTGSRATVASGMPRRALGSADNVGHRLLSSNEGLRTMAWRLDAGHRQVRVCEAHAQSHAAA